MCLLGGQQRLYVLVSKDLSPVYGCVQGSHAVCQWMLDNQHDLRWKNEYLIFLSADMEKITRKLDLHDVEHSKFHEPDLDGKLTAIAVLGHDHLFKNLQVVR